jgi:DNA primase
MIIEKENPKNPYHDRFRERIMYPIRDSRGRIIGFGGRVLGDDKPKYLNSPETPIFHKGEELYGLYEARQKTRHLERILIVEGYMDVIALAQNDLCYAVATLGTATSTTHLQRLFKLVPEVVFCFDGDNAGRQAAWRALEQALPLMKDGLSARFLFLPDGEDPDTQIRKTGKSDFEVAISKATPLSRFFLDSLSEKIDIATPEGKARLSNLAMPLINQIPAGIYRKLVTEQLATLTGTDVIALQATQPAIQQTREDIPVATPRNPERRPAFPDTGAKVADLSVCLKAVNLILMNPSVVEQTDETLEGIDVPDIALLRQVLTLARRYPGNNTPQLLGRLYATTEGSKLIQLANREQITPREGMAAEFAEIITSLVSRQHKKHKVKALLEEARQKLQERPARE